MEGRWNLNLKGMSWKQMGCCDIKGECMSLRREILEKLYFKESHILVYSAHPRGKKMCANMKELFFWIGMK